MKKERKTKHGQITIKVAHFPIVIPSNLSVIPLIQSDSCEWNYNPK